MVTTTTQDQKDQKSSPVRRSKYAKKKTAEVTPDAKPAAVSTFAMDPTKPPRIMPRKLDLSKLGIETIKKQAPSRDSYLRCCQITGSAIVFRCVPVDTTNAYGSWSEKVFFEALKTKAEWVNQLNISSTALKWVHDEVPQKNPKSYDIRLFPVYLRPGHALMPKDKLVQLGQLICDCINATPQNNTTLKIDEANYEWIQNAVWSDIVGVDEAYKLMKDDLGSPLPGFFLKNEMAIYRYFHAKTFSLELGRALYTPVTELHPSLQTIANEEDFQDNSDWIVWYSFCVINMTKN